MTTLVDKELENELQEMYMQATHWLQDISFLETETHFFKNIIRRYQFDVQAEFRAAEFTAKIAEQESRFKDLKVKVPVFLSILEPYISDSKKEMDLVFLNRYNALQNELTALFTVVRTTKNALFHFTEFIMPPTSCATT